MTNPSSPPRLGLSHRSNSISTILTIPTSLNTPSLFPTSSIPTIDTLNLSHILNGETCPPISFPDFSAFITHKEYTSENLLFVIWFRSYRARFNELPDETKHAVPVPSTKLGDRYDIFGYLDRAMEEQRVHGEREIQLAPESLVKTEESHTKHKGIKVKRLVVPPQHHFTTCEWTPEGGACQCQSHPDSKSKKRHHHHTPKPILHHSTLHPPLPPMGTTFLPPKDQPMREEAQRAFATFARKGGSRELGIGEDIREYTKKALERSTAPETFLPLYEEIYQVIESQSLPHFFSYAKTNINRPKQLFWYIVGIIDFCLGLLIYLSITFLLPRHPFGYRAYRLFSLIFLSFGAMQMYSAHLGFCSQVWGRSSRQIRPWEMDEHSDSDSDHELIQTPPSGSARKMSAAPGVDLDFDFDALPLNDLGGTIASPVGETQHGPKEITSWMVDTAIPSKEDEMTDFQRQQLDLRRPTFVHPPSSDLVFPAKHHATDVSVGVVKTEKKPKIFGPEKLVEDPRIKKLYDDIITKILVVGGAVAVVGVVLCLAVPMGGKA
ncbi:hypothetical protein P7C73_g2717, partial [Tremellales sp. Uapishka_1]